MTSVQKGSRVTGDAAGGRVAGERELRVDGTALLRVLVVAIVVLNVASAITIAVDAKEGGRWLLMPLERNPSTWFSGLQLALASGLALVVGRGREDEPQWRLMAGLLLLMSLDEVGALHEKLGGLPSAPHIGSRGWLGAGLLIAAFVAVRLLPWALCLPPRLRNALLLGAVVFLSGAIGVEWMAGTWSETHGEDQAFWAISSVEENAELLGVLVVVRALLRELRSTSLHLRIC